MAGIHAHFQKAAVGGATAHTYSDIPKVWCVLTEPRGNCLCISQYMRRPVRWINAVGKMTLRPGTTSGGNPRTRIHGYGGSSVADLKGYCAAGAYVLRALLDAETVDGPWMSERVASTTRHR